MRARGGGSGLPFSEGVNASERVAPPPCPPVHVIVFTRLPRTTQQESLPSHAYRAIVCIALSSHASPVPSWVSHCLHTPPPCPPVHLIVFTRLPRALVCTSLHSHASPVPSCASHCLQQPESVSIAVSVPGSVCACLTVSAHAPALVLMNVNVTVPAFTPGLVPSC